MGFGGGGKKKDDDKKKNAQTFIHDLKTEQGFDDIFHSHDTTNRTIFIDHQGNVFSFLDKLFKKVVDGFATVGHQ